ncbi:type IV secretion system T-DNA border endonuclease VirD2 [Albimonas donghaensis]|uniref:Type IV secretion system T-DNA border endonuclease VirD2 n=1 Tax=Albimonas donghaensis TaxID=356660 RepID=A0A1H3FRJ9_9RHOB|nr:relaxase/mobilization nuclease domain-containing protein [Albimonas donghaensis]SDX93683.1 type IV secretion system T-DNA border endonuclease VirD2 [Albimonas donghaensis]
MSMVAEMLRRGRAAPAHVSPVDAVMGEDWAEVDFSHGARRPTRAALMAAHRQDIRPGGAPMPPALPGRREQIVVKMVRTGGASNAAGLRAQLNYLSREGGVEVQRSEDFFGIGMDAEEIENVISAWNMPGGQRGGPDRTSHFIVSFPQSIDPAAAERAGRAWAEEMFGSGAYGGDCFDYVTAFHTDRAHPHMHVVVHRRGLDHDGWLKVSRRSDVNYQSMRALAAEIAQREGIEVEATPRLARGVVALPIPDAEIRRAAEQGRAPIAPEHTLLGAARTAAAIVHYARRFAAEAALLEDRAPALAKLLREASQAVAEGRELTEARMGRPIDPEEEKTMAQTLAGARQEARDKIAAVDARIEAMRDPVEQVKFQRQAAMMKAEAAPVLGDAGLMNFARPAEQGRYAGLPAGEGRVDAIRAEADRRVSAIAERAGLNGAAMVERYSGGAPSRALAESYAKSEAKERENRRAITGAPEETAAQRDAALTAMHREIGAVYRAARELARQEAGRDEAPAADRATAPEKAMPERATPSPTRDAGAGQGPTSRPAPRDDADDQARREQERARRIAARKARGRDGGGHGL